MPHQRTNDDIQMHDNKQQFAMFSPTLSALGAICRLLVSCLFSPLRTIEIFLPNLWRYADTSRFDPIRDIPSLAGRVILVTGGNAGIGLETIVQLSKHDPSQIFLAARSESKANQAMDIIRRQKPDAAITWLQLDLTSLSSVKEAAQKVLEDSDRLDILILNAGIMGTPPGITNAGHDMQLGTNHVGHFFLAKLLLPRLNDTARLPNSDVRVITVASEANRMAPAFETITSNEKLTRADPWTRYGASKACNIMFAAELARRHPDITSVSVHPGLIRTELYTPGASASSVLRVGLGAVSWAFVSVQDGALTQLNLAAGTRKDEVQNGQYYTPYGRLQESQWAQDIDKGIALWEWTETELAKAGY